MKLFVILDKDGNTVKTYRRKNNIWYYTSLGAAKTAAKIYIKHKNQRLTKELRLHFEDFHIIEYELTEKVKHPL